MSSETVDIVLGIAAYETGRSETGDTVMVVGAEGVGRVVTTSVLNVSVPIMGTPSCTGLVVSSNSGATVGTCVGGS